MRFLRNTSLCGLDIRPSQLRIVFEEQFDCTKLPESCFERGKVQDFELISQHVEQRVNQLGLRGTPTAIGLPTELVFSKSLDCPHPIKRSALREHIDHELRRELNTFPADSLEVRWDSASYHVVRRDYLFAYQQSISRAGLKVKFIDSNLHALLHFYKHHLEEDTYALIVNEKEVITLVIFAKNILFCTQFSEIHLVKQRLLLQDQRINHIYFCNLVGDQLDLNLKYQVLASNINSPYYLAAGLALRSKRTW